MRGFRQGIRYQSDGDQKHQYLGFPSTDGDQKLARGDIPPAGRRGVSHTPYVYPAVE